MEEPACNCPEIKHRFRVCFFNLLLVFFSTLISVGIVEVSLRIFVPIQYPLTNLWVRAWLYNELLGWTSIPNSYMGSKKITNGLGFRGREFDRNRSPGKSRIVISGDSFAFGYGVLEAARCFPEIMMKQHLQGTEIINMGCSGYGTDQEFISYKTIGSEYNPDLVVLIFYPNDFVENLITYDNGLISPDFVFTENGTLKLSNVPVPITNGWGKDWVQPTNFREHLFLNSRLFNLWQQFQISRLDKSVQAYDLYPNKELIARSAVTMAILREFWRACKLNGTSFMIVTLPYMGMIEEAEWQELKNEYGVTEEQRFEPYERFFDPLVKEGVPVLHLSQTLLSKRRAGYKLMADTHRHLNEDGHRFLASELAEFIRKHALLPNTSS